MPHVLGKSLPNKNKEASVLGAVAGAHYIRQVLIPSLSLILAFDSQIPAYMHACTLPRFPPATFHP